MLKTKAGTYALILQTHSNESIQIGRWGQLHLQPGYYIYVGSAFGPGGVRARVSRHLRTDKRVHWHIDYLLESVMPVKVWVTYEAQQLEHDWSGALFKMRELSPIPYFGCSDCNCYSHLFFTPEMPESRWLGEIETVTI